jgi:hypothetical protein
MNWWEQVKLNRLLCDGVIHLVTRFAVAFSTGGQMHDGMAQWCVADWPLLMPLVKTLAGASWVSLHHGGGSYGHGYIASMRGMVIVVTEQLTRWTIEKEFYVTDPGLGVIRHAGCGIWIGWGGGEGKWIGSGWAIEEVKSEMWEWDVSGSSRGCFNVTLNLDRQPVHNKTKTPVLRSSPKTTLWTGNNILLANILCHWLWV